MKNYIETLRKINNDGSQKGTLDFKSGFDSGFKTCLDMIEEWEDKQKDDGIQHYNKI